MHSKDFWSVTSKNIRRQPLRTSLTLFALSLSTCVVVLMAGISLGGYQAMYGQFGSGDALQTVSVTASQAQSSLSPFGDVTQVTANKQLTDDTVRQLAGVTYVTHAEPRAQIWEFASFTLGDSKQYALQASGVLPTADISLSAGSMFGTDASDGKIILGYNYAKALGLSPQQLVGQTVHITTQNGYRGVGAAIPTPASSPQQIAAFTTSPTVVTATVVGVSQPGPDQNMAFVSLDWARQIRTIHYYDGGQLKTTDQIARDGYSSIQLTADSLQHVQSVADSVKALGYGQTSLLATVHQLNQVLAIITIILGLVAVIALLSAALGVINTMLMAVSEQTFEIGIWRACGAPRSLIIRMLVHESIILGFLGGLIGVAVSVPFAMVITYYAASLLAAQGLQAINLITISPLLAVGAIVVTCMFSAIAGIYPAYKAARIDPSKALSSQ